jgi:ribosomal protein S18 acetylase RimI-like enzyme
MMEFKVRRCGPGDERALSALGRATFLETYAGTAEASDILAYMETEHSVEHYQRWFTGRSAHIWVVETAIGGSAIGYLVALDLDDAGLSNQMEIKRIYLLYRFHHNRIGNLLIDEILATAREKRVTALILKVQEANKNAIGFYFRHGFRIVGDEPLRAGERDYRVLIMKLDLYETQHPGATAAIIPSRSSSV